MQRTIIQDRYYRLIDGEPVQMGYTQLEDVPRRVDIGVDRETTSFALEESAFAVGASSMAAPRTLLGSIFGVNQESRFANILSFIFDKLSKLEIAPVRSQSVESFTFVPISDFFQIFHCKNIIGFLNNSLRDGMICICHEPSLSLAKPFEFSFSGASADRLKHTPIIGVSSPHTTHFGTTEKGVIGSNGNVPNTHVDTKNLIIINFKNIICLDNYVYGGFIFIPMDAQCTSFDIPIDIFMKIFGDMNIIFHSTDNSSQLDNTRLQEYFGSSQVVADGSVRFLMSSIVVMIAFEHLNSIISGALDKCGWKIRIAISDGSIQLFMEFIFRGGFQFNGLSDVESDDLIISMDRIQNLRCQFNGQTNCSLHIISNIIGDIYNLSGEMGESISIRNHFSSPSLQAAGYSKEQKVIKKLLDI